MIIKDLELILIESLIHTPETRIDFYLSKAKENNCTPVNFCLALKQAYDRLEKYVNSNDYTTWEIDETGKKQFMKKTINLLHYSDNRYIGFLDNENITDLLPGLLELTKKIKINLEKEVLQSHELISKHINNNRGFQSNLTDDQIQLLFEQLRGKYIDINSNPDHFKAIFKPESLPPGFISIKRVKKFTGTLLAYFVSELFQKDNPSDYWHIAESCFDKAKNLRQSLNNTVNYNPGNKPKGYKDIDKIIKSIYTSLQ